MKRRADGRWRKSINIDGKIIYFYSSAETEKQAIKDIEHQMLNFKSNAFKKKHNFKMLCDAMLEKQSKSIGYSAYSNYCILSKHLSEFYDYDIEDVSPSMAQALIDRMAKLENYSYHTISKVKVLLGLVLNYAIVEENLPVHNYIRSIRIPKGTKKGKVSSPPDEVSKMIIENVTKVDFGLWALCLLCTGMRRGELAAIQVKDIDLEKNEISINKSVEFIGNQPHVKSMPKTEASIGTVPILDILKPHLSEKLKNLSSDDFLFGGSKPLTRTQIKRRWHKYCQEIGYDLNGHQLRHAYAKIIYKAGIDVKTAQRLLRHADFTTTMNIYTDFSKSMTDKSVSVLNDFLTSL